ncbi:hypothetical protein LLH00_18185 [bacterium]|nr:hypothetical protein [bacterium]
MARNGFFFIRPAAGGPAGRPGANPLAPQPTAAEHPEAPEIHTPLVEEQETTSHLGGKRRRFNLRDLGRVAGFLL